MTWTSVFGEMDLIWLPIASWPVEKNRNRIISLWCFYQNRDFDFVFISVFALFDENPLFHLEPSGACFEGFCCRVLFLFWEDSFCSQGPHSNSKLLLYSEAALVIWSYSCTLGNFLYSEVASVVRAHYCSRILPQSSKSSMSPSTPCRPYFWPPNQHKCCLIDSVNRISISWYPQTDIRYQKM